MDKLRFIQRLENRIPARWHMTFICMITIACGIFFSKVLLFSNLSQPMIRYGLAVVFSYLVFFALIYTWLRWHFGANTNSKSSNTLDAIDVLDIPMNIDLSETRWFGGGGNFSGGGSSSSWEGGNHKLFSSSNSSLFSSSDSSLNSSSRIDGPSSIPDIDEGLCLSCNRTKVIVSGYASLSS